MQTIGSLFQVLNQSLPIDLIVLGLLVYMLFKMNGMSKDINVLSKDMMRIDQKLDNHITDTNKKIDNLSGRFDRLYELLLKDKIENK